MSTSHGFSRTPIRTVSTNRPSYLCFQNVPTPGTLAYRSLSKAPADSGSVENPSTRDNSRSGYVLSIGIVLHELALRVLTIGGACHELKIWLLTIGPPHIVSTKFGCSR